MKLLRFLFSFKFLGILIVLALSLMAATNFFSLELEQEEIKTAFEKNKFEPNHHFVELDSGRIHYVTAGDSSLPPLLLIHGSPGSWDNWVKLLTETDILSDYFVIAIDRPGYGKSTLPEARSLQQQSQLLKPVIERYFNQGGVVMGHSYGGALSLRVAVDYPSKFHALLTIAGTVSDSLQQPRWYNHMASHPPAKWIISNRLICSNKEMTQLPENLQKLYPKLNKLEAQVAIIQGKNDFLVDSQSASYLEHRLKGVESKIFWREEMNHFVIWSDLDIILQALEWTRIGSSEQ